MLTSDKSKLGVWDVQMVGHGGALWFRCGVCLGAATGLDVALAQGVCKGLKAGLAKDSLLGGLGRLHCRQAFGSIHSVKCRHCAAAGATGQTACGFDTLWAAAAPAQSGGFDPEPGQLCLRGQRQRRIVVG